ncbi:MAG: hypothetical protein ACW98K_11050 [Candidatus Kariarchaeaceae archaeon]|jgi:hypothetical protein
MAQEQPSHGTSKASRYYDRLKAIGLILLVLFAVAPVLLAALPNAESNQTFSVYNEGWDGLSVVKNQIEGILDGSNQKYEVTNIISNLNVLNRFNGSGVLFIIGPAARFDVTETISLILYILKGGSVVIADDYGSGNDILDPIFSAFENIDKFAESSEELGFDVPNLSEILFEGEESNDTSDPGAGGTDLLDPSAALAEEQGGDIFSELLGNLILRFGFNTSGVLMDAGSNNGNPTRPIITEIDDTVFEGSFTQGVNKIQMEFASIISVKLKISETEIDNDGNEILVNKTVWQPLQKLSASLLNSDSLFI